LAKLVKQRDFWKTKNHKTASWAFFAHIKPSSSKANSSSNLIELFMCVLYYLVGLVAKLKKGIITYKRTNGIFATRKHLKTTHPEVWIEWIE
jgi:hypothetical protein